MSLVAYSSSEDEEGDGEASTPPAKKRKLSSTLDDKRAPDLPPLPSSFLDQYSSTVRTSTQDDPSLHGGRKRVTAHVKGNWPAHVFMECVSLPLHISLSRPLVLKTNQKDRFLQDLKDRLEFDGGIKAFTVRPKDLAWHPNESDTRWFLVLRLESATGGADSMQHLQRLLERCNDVVQRFGQPELYASDANKGSESTSAADDKERDGDGQFHLSVAWSLTPPEGIASNCNSGNGVDDSSQQASSKRNDSGSDEVAIPHDLLGKLRAVSITFTEVKVRIGQDVHRLPLKVRRRRSSALVS